MKKLSVRSFVFVFVFALLLVGCVAVPAVAPQSALGQGLIGLPDDAKVLVLSLLTAGIAYLLNRVNMGQYTQALAAVIAPIIITAIEAGLQTIPSIFDNLILSLIHLIVLFLAGSIGTLVFVKRAKTPKTLLAG